MRRVGFAELRRRADTRQPSTHCHDTAVCRARAERQSAQPVGKRDEHRRRTGKERPTLGSGRCTTQMAPSYKRHDWHTHTKREAVQCLARAQGARRLMVHKDAQICSGEISRSRQHTGDAIRRRARKARSVAPERYGKDPGGKVHIASTPHCEHQSRSGAASTPHTLEHHKRSGCGAYPRRSAQCVCIAVEDGDSRGVGKPQVLLLSPPLLLGSSASELAPAPCSPSGSGAVGARVRCSCR